MSVPTQTRIGPYEIVGELGHGGMGEVYLARDTRLDRQVAIKALPAHLTSDADRLARFQREAKVLASLNHPAIGAIYGMEEAAGHRYLILEFVEGETLADRLKRGPIPIDEALPIARQITEALEVAHEKGIVHRDLKPGNVMVTPDGNAKVLDFGLARTVEGTPSSISAAALSDSPTLTTPLHSPTIAGVIMGTAGYMSPEQARGKPVDKRSDIFSFGCVLYEMLAGAMPFRGETVADAIGATLHKDLDFGLLPPGTPGRVRDLLTSCLAKDRRQRLHDIGDARLEIERAIAEPRDRGSHAIATRPWWRSAGVLATVSLVAIAITTAASVAFLRPTRETAAADQRVLRAALVLPKGMTLLEGLRAVAVSPSGTQVVLALLPKESATPPALFLRDLSRLEFRPLAGTEGASYPFWSPDGTSIAFFADGKLKRLDLAAGIVRELCDAPVPRGGSWGTKGTIVFAPSAGGGLMIVSDAGGTPTPITTSTTPGESHRSPQILPDGQRFLYYIQNTGSDGVYSYDPATKQSRPLLLGWSEAFFVEPGLLVFARDENLLAQPFNPQTLELTGTAQPIAAGVQYDKTRAYINAGISSRGTLIYQLVNPPIRYKFAWMDRKGERTPLNVEPLALAFDGARLSKDGRRAAVSLLGNRAETSVSIVDLERGIRTPLGDPATIFSFGNVWGPGDQSVIVSEVKADRQSLVSLSLSGGPGTRILDGESGFEPAAGSITPDGKTLLYTLSPLSSKLPDIMTKSLGDDQSPKRFMQTPEGEWYPLLSPTGDVVAYTVSKEDDPGGPVKVVAYPTPSASVQVSTIPAFLGGVYWIGTNELAWVDPSKRAWSVTVTAADGKIDIGPAKPMFDGKPVDKQVRILDYDIAHERFLVAIQDEPRDEPRIIIVSDWRQDAIGSQPEHR